MSDAVHVRRATAADAEALHALAALTFPLACPPTTTDEAKAAFIAEHLSREAFDRYLADPDRTVLVADGLLGYAIVVHGEPSDPDARLAITTRPTAELSKLYVHPQRHGGGIARALVDAAIADARERGALSLWLGVNIHNARANRFYDKNGFAIVGSKRFRVGEVLEEDHVRERPLRD